MTPEQRAFYEYGIARERFIAAKKRYNESKRGLFSTGSVTRNIRQMSREVPGIDDMMRDLHSKRAVCEAWAPTNRRSCSNCKHRCTKLSSEPCCDCLYALYEGNTSWEPREEN